VPSASLLLPCLALGLVFFSLCWQSRHLQFREQVYLIPRHGTLRDYIGVPVFAVLFTLFDIVSRIGRLPPRPSKIVFIIGIPRAGTTSTHRSLVHCTGATCATGFDVAVPPVPVGLPFRKLFLGIVRYVAAGLSGNSSSRHKISLDEPEEEDQSLILLWRNAASITTASASLTHGMVLNGHHHYEWNQSCMELIDRCIRWKCALEGSDFWIGKPLSSTRHYAMLMKHFPEAKFVVCWREPAAVIASAFSLIMQFERHVTMEDAKRDFMNELGVHYPSFYRAVLELREKYADDDRFAFNPFTEWKANPEKQVERICSRLNLALVDSSPPPKSEEPLSAAEAAKFRAMAETMIKDHWEGVWRPIYEAFGFPKPAYV